MKQVREYMERTKEVVPTRGTVHDLGRAITHKRIIIRLYLEGYLTPEIARRTKHSTSIQSSRGVMVMQSNLCVHTKYENMDKIYLYPIWEFLVYFT